MKSSEICLKKIGTAIGIAVFTVFMATTAYANWKWQQGVCIHFSPNGSEKMLYGADCNLPTDTSVTEEPEI